MFTFCRMTAFPVAQESAGKTSTSLVCSLILLITHFLHCKGSTEQSDIQTGHFHADIHVLMCTTVLSLRASCRRNSPAEKAAIAGWIFGQ